MKHVTLIAAIGLVFTCGSSRAQSAQEVTPSIEVTITFADEGTHSVAWLEAVRVFGEDAAARAAQERRPASPLESGWVSLIEDRAVVWESMADSLHVPFAGVPPPASVLVLVGRAGGRDAFTFSSSGMGFDVSELAEIYGDAYEVVNQSRIDRFFAHEYTHLLHKAWQRAHQPHLDTPLERALWECLVEGLGNYRSLSARWVDDAGSLTPHARRVLERLQVTFVERIAAMQHASDAEAEHLMEGISTGPFDEKWGALTVALWLAEEARGDDARLRKWVDAGPRGVLTLARTYLPENLRAMLPSD